jgi:hypothetical protein
MDGDTSHISHTIIDGSHAPNPDSASVVYFISGEDTTSILCGFTIQGGKGTYWDIWESMGGAGIYITHSTATIRNNIIQNNELNDTLTADLWGCCGGGILVSYGTPGWVVIENNRIVNNKVFSNHLYANGGGFQVYITNTRIQNNIVSNNLTKNTGIGVGGYAGPAGIMCESDTVPMIAIIRDNLVENNETRAYETGYGAGMGTWLLANGSMIENNRIINNKNDWNGGGLDIYSSSFTTLIIKNNYLIGNEAMNGGAIDVEWDTTSQVL